MSTVRDLLEQASSNLEESMGVRATDGRPNLAPVSDPRDVGRRPLRNVGRVDVDRVVPDPDQPRTEFDEAALDRLAASLRDAGQLAPIRVRWAAGLGKWVIVAGERRWRAARRAGLATIDCVFVDGEPTRGELLSQQLIENLLREDLRPVEEARAFRELLALNGWTGKQLAEALRVPPSKVSRSLALLELPDDLQRRVEAGDLPARAAYEIAKVGDDGERRTLAEAVQGGGMTVEDRGHGAAVGLLSRVRHMEFLTGLFDTSDFPARWRCGHWTPAHGWLHILSDVAVWAAYFAIPLVLGYFAARRRDLPFRRVFLLFVAFILLCGATHLMEAVIFWWPAYRLAGVLKLLTAVVSWVTVLALIPVAPAVLAMRTPEELEREVAARTDAERRLTGANAELERRVEERTAELGRAVEAEAEQKERLRTTLASIGDAVISTDRDGTVTYLNPVAESLTGWTNAEAAGVPLTRVFQIVNEDTRQPVENPALRALTEGVIVGLANHTVLIAKDGTERPIDDSAAPIRCKDGEVVGGVLVFRDISEKKRLEGERREAQERVVATLESTTDAFTRFDRDWRIVYVNAEAERLTGRRRSDLLGKNHWDTFPTTVGTPLEAEYRRAVAERVTVEFEHYFHPLGRWLAVKGDPTPDGGLTVFFRDITGQKVQQEALAASEARYRELAAESDRQRRLYETVLTNTPDFVYVFSLDHRVVYANDSLIRMWGRGHDGAIGKTFLEIGYEPWHADMHDREIDQVRATKQPIRGEVPFDGTLGRRQYDYIFVPVLGADGEVEAVAGTTRDVTDRKEAEVRVRESEERFRLVADAAPVLIWLSGTDKLCYWFNQPWLAFTGRSMEQEVGNGWAEGVHPDDFDRCLQTYIAAFDARTPFSMEYRLRRHDGEYRWLLDAGVPRYGPGGELDGYIGSCIDIHDRMQAEVTLKASEVRYRWLFESGKDGILILDAHAATISDANPFMAEMLGYSRDEFVGKELWQIGLFKDAEASKAAVRELQEERYIRYDDLPLETKAGRRINVEFVSNVYVEDGEAVIQCNVRDITDRKRLEDSLRQHAAALTEADRRKDVFLATLAHELRNPLAPIRNGLQVIRLAGANGTVEQARSMMERQLTQLVRLVDDLLDVSRVTTGKLTLSTGRLDLRAVIDAALETSRPVVEQAGHDLTVIVPDEPIIVQGDLTRLAQVVSNLLTNSAKYTHRGGHIRVSVGRVDGTAVVSVRDDGIGIPPAMLGRVFEMFTQVDRTLEKTTGGLGIGLSLVKGLVEMHGGTIAARSEGEGRGSEFVVRLPVASPAPAVSDGSDKAGEEVVPPGPRRILVVDDNADAADSPGQLLEMLGNEVRTAYDGEAGVAAAGAFRPNVLFMDIGMPVLNGYDAARRIRTEPWGKDMLLVALTGWGQEDDRKRTADAGFDHHLVKPVEAAALMRLLAGLNTATA